MSEPSGDSTSIVSIISVPDGVFRGADTTTVPFVLFPLPKNKIVGEVDWKPLLLLTRTVKFPPVPLVITVKGTENGVPGIKMLSESA